MSKGLLFMFHPKHFDQSLSATENHDRPLWWRRLYYAKLSGDGVTFLHGGGTIAECRLSAGEIVHVNPGSVMAFEPSVQFEIQSVKNIKTALFGGEGMFFAQLTGPGNAWMQSLLFLRLAGRMMASAPRTTESSGIASAAVDGDRE